jgi:predicted enzyme related to lactoylglutathione lyase
MHGQFVWYELTTPDVDAAKKFYPRFTDWGTQAFDANYTMFTTKGLPIAGIFRLNDEMKANGVPPNWMPYIECDNVDATADKARSLGASVVVGPDDIPGTGRFAVVRDPQGAMFGIYKSSRQSIAWDGTNVVGRFSWHELMTTDHEVAAKFYSALFGWSKISEMDMGPGAGMYYMFGQNGKMYGGMYTTPPEMAGMHPFWLVYIHVKDVGKAVGIATKNGATVHRPQMDIPGGSIAILGDPQGAGFAVHHAAAVEAPKAVTAVKAAAKAVVKAVKKVVKKVAKKTAPKKKAAKKAKAPARKAAKARPKTKAKARPRSAPRKKAPKAKPRRKAKAKK